jgi:Flp pilus assembly protein CpaB
MLRRHRRTLGAALVAAAVLVLATQLRPPPPATVPVVVAARDLPAATTLSADDLTVVPVPPAGAGPASLTDPADLLGRVLAGPVPSGEALSSSRLRGPSVLAAQPPGTVALPLRLADAGAAALLAGGDRIDVLTAVADDVDGTRGVTVAEDVPVLLVPTLEGIGSGLGTLGSDAPVDPLAGDGLAGGLVVVATTTGQARDLVAAGSQAPLWFVLRP